MFLVIAMNCTTCNSDTIIFSLTLFMNSASACISSALAAAFNTNGYLMNTTQST